ncbi:hypothetical protein HJC10_32635 [Corallococcus exiguus]|uniref:hypothetical protein n=1 Tax=Corallococcus TaxID=83461 RepID=UPI000EC3A99D|nr:MULTISPECIES: hypothetical protein [Corallococcus]NNB91131.1 hypothetical protein [Corallococcus exiguus]NNB98864.1 hypothetical protein [Corallococcus exiguus]NNC07579.1 hypothetical protein [Corallococcus exiguus]NPC51537.1 hypothetical protein [Corallococcus exiguus]RKH84967.1 hypothetical protein D7X99_07585 [Corallococcus sp. AB032C]
MDGGPQSAAAAKRGHLLPADRDVLVSCLGSAGAAVDAKLDSAVPEVHAAEQAYMAELAERDAMEQRLTGDIASFGPYRFAFVLRAAALYSAALRR